jgi:hypothetical protein
MKTLPITEPATVFKVGDESMSARDLIVHWGIYAKGSLDQCVYLVTTAYGEPIMVDADNQPEIADAVLASRGTILVVTWTKKEEVEEEEEMMFVETFPNLEAFLMKCRSVILEEKHSRLDREEDIVVNKSVDYDAAAVGEIEELGED